MHVLAVQLLLDTLCTRGIMDSQTSPRHQQPADTQKVYRLLKTYKEYGSRRDLAGTVAGLAALGFCALMMMPGQLAAATTWWTISLILVVVPTAAFWVAWLLAGIPGRKLAIAARMELESIVAHGENTDEYRRLRAIYRHDRTYQGAIKTLFDTLREPPPKV